MIHTPKVSFACHRECSFDRTYIQQRKERCERDFRCVSCSRSSSPWCPQLILSLSILREQTCTTRKSTDTERLRETLQPRLKYQEQHALSLSRDVHARGKRERHTKTTRENTKRTSRDTIDEGFSPTHKCSFLYRENVSVCSNIKRKQKTKDGKLKRQKKPRSSPVCVSEARSLGLRKETENEAICPRNALESHCCKP